MHQIAALWCGSSDTAWTLDRVRVRYPRMGVGGVATRNLRQGDVIFAPTARSRRYRGGESVGRSSRHCVPLVITTSVVMDQKGPLGRLPGRQRRRGSLREANPAPTTDMARRESDTVPPPPPTTCCAGASFTSAKAHDRQNAVAKRRDARDRGKRPGKGGGVIDDAGGDSKTPRRADATN